MELISNTPKPNPNARTSMEPDRMLTAGGERRREEK